jgi:hypothetical protein
MRGFGLDRAGLEFQIPAAWMGTGSISRSVAAIATDCIQLPCIAPALSGDCAVEHRGNQRHSTGYGALPSLESIGKLIFHTRFEAAELP